MHRLLRCIRRFDEAGGWVPQGALSCAHWLTWRIGFDIGAAREHVRVARALGGLPRIDEALRLGKVSYSKVRALTRAADPGNEATLLEWAENSTGAELEKVIAKYRRVMRVEGFLPVDDPAFRFVRRRDTATGMVQVTAQLLPEEAAIVMKALEIARERLSESAEVSAGTSTTGLRRRLAAERRESADRVDGLLWLAEAALGGKVGDVSPASPVEVVVHVDQAELDQGDRGPDSSLDDGRSIEPESTERLLCDAAVVRVVEDARGSLLDVGRRTRSIPTPIKRALRARDGGCRFPGCGRQRTDGHHIVRWSKGGATSLGNLVSLCRRHHRFVHEAGWRIETSERGGLRFCDTFGSYVPTHDVRGVIHGDAIEVLRADLADAGINIDASTAHPHSMGTPDYGAAVEALIRKHVPKPDCGEADVSAETLEG